MRVMAKKMCRAMLVPTGKGERATSDPDLWIGAKSTLLRRQLKREFRSVGNRRVRKRILTCVKPPGGNVAHSQIFLASVGASHDKT